MSGSKKLGDLRLTMSVRDIIVAIADGRIKKLRPEDRYAVVQSIDYTLRKATVRYHGGTNDIPLPFVPHVQPTHVGQLVRVSGGVANRYISALVDPPTGTAATLGNGWANFGAPYANAGYRRDHTGRVHLYGVIKSGTLGSAALTLPAGFRPLAARMVAAAGGSGTAGTVSILADGSVIPQTGFPGGNAFVAFDAINFSTG